MAKTIRTKVYSFNELSDEAKEKAINQHYDINVFFDWWDSTYEDAANIGLRITGFDIDRGSYCKGVFIESPEKCAEQIKSDHGKECETYKTACNFLQERTELVSKYSDSINTNKVTEDNGWDFDKECDELEDEFLKSLLEDYRIILQKEFEYLTSEKAIVETIEANDYLFTKDGKIFNA